LEAFKGFSKRRGAPFLKTSKGNKGKVGGGSPQKNKETNGGGSLKNKRGHQTGLYSNRHLAGGSIK
jgi:hypothetical protein